MPLCAQTKSTLNQYCHFGEPPPLVPQSAKVTKVQIPPLNFTHSSGVPSYLGLHASRLQD